MITLCLPCMIISVYISKSNPCLSVIMIQAYLHYDLDPFPHQGQGIIAIPMVSYMDEPIKINPLP